MQLYLNYQRDKRALHLHLWYYFGHYTRLRQMCVRTFYLFEVVSLMDFTSLNNIPENHYENSALHVGTPYKSVANTGRQPRLKMQFETQTISFVERIQNIKKVLTPENEICLVTASKSCLYL